MKRITRVFSLFLIAALVCSTFTVSETSLAKKKVKVSFVKISNTKGKLRLQKGKKFKLKTTVKTLPNKKAFQKVTFKSANKRIVAVNSKGVLTGKKMGTTKITVASKTNPKKKARISVTVTDEILVTKISLNKTYIEVSEDSDADIQLQITKILPANAENKEIEWTTDDEDVADVDDNGLVIIGEEGETTITAMAVDEGGAYAECEVIVTEGEDSDEEDTGEEVMDTDTSEDVVDND